MDFSFSHASEESPREDDFFCKFVVSKNGHFPVNHDGRKIQKYKV